MRRAARAYVQGRQRLLNDKPWAIEVFRKYLQIDDESVLLDTYTRFTRYLPLPPVLPLASLERVREDAAAEDPAVLNVPISEVAVPRFVEELEAMGFFASLR